VLALSPLWECVLIFDLAVITRTSDLSHPRNSLGFLCFNVLATYPPSALWGKPPLIAIRPELLVVCLRHPQGNEPAAVVH